ncbi:MAG: bifunctional response regulator/alkaline phosphatase family protein [Gemmatimonadetes bacterium]|nr:bifunctional response regulator/alkaline phosphatase family protein [Gemmatimonadota bacterium]
MEATKTKAGRILWVDDEVDLLRPHLMLLRSEGYQVDAIMNGQDALELLSNSSYDLVLLDEQMPGLRGIEVLDRVRRSSPRLPVVMVTKSEEHSTMHEAIGRRADDYIVKPTSPRQVLSVVTRILAGPALQHEQIARDFSRRFGELRELLTTARTWSEWATLYSELIDWDLKLEEAGEAGLRDILQSLMTDLSRGFCDLVAARYGDWVHEGGDKGPALSVDVIPRFFAPLLTEDPAALLVVMDCMRLGQWRAIMPLLGDYFEIDEELYASILPTATPYARNAIFGGVFPDELAELRPEWWERGEEIGYNSFEDELFERHIHKTLGHRLPTHYEKIFSSEEGEAMIQRLGGYLSSPSATALVFGFVDMLTHGRAESRLIWEMARDTSALRSLTVTWFERSTAFRALKLAAQRGVRVLMTTDHGSLHCHRPATIYAKRDATANLRYKFGEDLRVENPGAVFTTSDADELRLPPGGLKQTYALCREDYFFVYPTKLREYQNRYRDSFLHGGVSPDEIVLPVALLTPR